MCDVLYKYSLALLVTPDRFDYNDKERRLEVGRVLYSQSREAGTPSPVTLKAAGSRSCAQRTPRSGTRSPVPTAPWTSGSGEAGPPKPPCVAPNRRAP